jgi:amino acid permease
MGIYVNNSPNFLILATLFTTFLEALIVLEFVQETNQSRTNIVSTNRRHLTRNISASTHRSILIVDNGLQ